MPVKCQHALLSQRPCLHLALTGTFGGPITGGQPRHIVVHVTAVTG